MKYGNLEKLRAFNKESDLNVSIRLISEFLDNNYAKERDKTSTLIISLNKVARAFPPEHDIISNLLDNFSDTYDLFKACIEHWCENKRELMFEVPDSLVPEINFNKINHMNENKLYKFYGIVDSIEDWVSIPKIFYFECPQCGESKNLMARRGRCKCGHVFKKPTKIFFRSRKTFHLMQKEQGNSNVAPVYYEMTTQKIQTQIFDNSAYSGANVEILAVPMQTETRGKYIEEEMTWELKLVGIKSRKFRNITKDRASEIAKKIRQTPDAFKKIAYSMAKKTYGMDYLKMFALASFIGLKGVDEDIENKNPAYNGLAVGDPASGKSFTIKQFFNYFPVSEYCQGSSTSTAGLLGGVDKGKSGRFIVRAGIVQQCDGGVVVMDELDKMHPEQTKGLFTALSEGRHTITKVTGTHTFSYNTGFICIANPKESKFLEGDKIAQIDLDSAYLSRMVWIYFARKPYYTTRTGHEIDEEKHKIHQAYVSGRLCYHQDFDDEFLKDYAIIVKNQPNAMMGEDAKIACEEYYSMRKLQAHKKVDYENGEEFSKKSIDDRFLGGLILLCKIIARSLFCKEVAKEHFDLAVEIMEEGMLKDMEMMGTGTLDDFQTKVEFVNRKPSLKSKQDRYIQFKKFIPYDEDIHEQEVYDACEKIGISEDEVDFFIQQGFREVDLFSKSDGYLRRAGKRRKKNE